jgi:hypothetical protein
MRLPVTYPLACTSVTRNTFAHAESGSFHATTTSRSWRHT